MKAATLTKIKRLVNDTIVLSEKLIHMSSVDFDILDCVKNIKSHYEEIMNQLLKIDANYYFSETYKGIAYEKVLSNEAINDLYNYNNTLTIILAAEYIKRGVTASNEMQS